MCNPIQGLKLLGLLSLVLLIAAGCEPSDREVTAQEPPPQERRVKVSVTKVEPTAIRDILILPGETKPWQDVTVAANEAGRIDWLGPQEGNEVKAEELLLKIDLMDKKAALENAQANYQLADDQYNRRKNLYAEKIISREEFEQAKNQRTVAAGMLRQAKVQYEHCFVKSPIDGTVNYLYVDQGEFVTKGGKVADIVNIDRIEIEVNVPELDVKYIKVDQPCLVMIDALPENHIPGLVGFVAYKAAPATRTFRVKVILNNSDHKIRPGMIARVIFQKRIIPDALVAPLFAIVDRGGERLLYVEEDGTAHARTISIGVIEGDTVQITSGLEAGDNLIVTGHGNVQEGTKVLVQ